MKVFILIIQIPLLLLLIWILWPVTPEQCVKLADKLESSPVPFHSASQFYLEQAEVLSQESDY